MLLFRLRNEKDEANDRADQLASQLKDVQDSLSQAENDRDDLHRKVKRRGVVLLSPGIVSQMFFVALSQIRELENEITNCNLIFKFTDFETVKLLGIFAIESLHITIIGE